MTSKPQGPPFNLGQEGESEDLRTQGNRWTIGLRLTKKLSIFSAMYPCVPFNIICAQVFPKCPSGEGSPAELRQPWLRWRTWHRVWTKEDRWVSFRMWSDKRYILRIQFMFSWYFAKYIFLQLQQPCVPHCSFIFPASRTTRDGVRTFFSLGHFFSRAKDGVRTFFLSWAFFSLCCDQVDDEGGNQVQKDKSNLFLGAGECISAQQSPIRHISRRGREGAGLLISWYFYYVEN